MGKAVLNCRLDLFGKHILLDPTIIHEGSCSLGATAVSGTGRAWYFFERHAASIQTLKRDDRQKPQEIVIKANITHNELCVNTWNHNSLQTNELE